MVDAARRRADDVDLRSGIHGLLRLGVLLSGAALVAGLALAAGGSPRAQPVLRAGIAILMSTPLARVFALLVGYGRKRDWPFFWISAGVLALLGVGVLLGARH